MQEINFLAFIMLFPWEEMVFSQDLCASVEGLAMKVSHTQ